MGHRARIAEDVQHLGVCPAVDRRHVRQPAAVRDFSQFIDESIDLRDVRSPQTFKLRGPERRVPHSSMLPIGTHAQILLGPPPWLKFVVARRPCAGRVTCSHGLCAAPSALSRNVRHRITRPSITYRRLRARRSTSGRSLRAVGRGVDRTTSSNDTYLERAFRCLRCSRRGLLGCVVDALSRACLRRIVRQFPFHCRPLAQLAARRDSRR